MIKSYANVTLTSLSGDLEVTVFLPEGIGSNEDPSDFFYRSTRFEHGSMIGGIRRTTAGGRAHKLYGAEMWRTPHDPLWPESGLGLASEFGIGDDGSFCFFRCGWHEVDDVTNGLLGYPEAKPGEPFLKIGVGKLIKGSCAACDSTDDYKFNSPYEFASKPHWDFSQPSVDTIVLEHQETLAKDGYKLRKQISLEANVLRVQSTLTNLGSTSFSTAWYSHHFFSCDRKPIGPGYSVDMGLQPQDNFGPYEDQSWAIPLTNYATVQTSGETVFVEMVREIEHGVRIKAEFNPDLNTKGTFTISACETSIVEDIAEFVDEPYDPISMYAFNLYMERTTISPEPQLFIRLAPGQSKTWTQRLAITDDLKLGPTIPDQSYPQQLSLTAAELAPSLFIDPRKHLVAATFFVAFFCLSLLFMTRRSDVRRQEYTQLPDSMF